MKLLFALLMYTYLLTSDVTVGNLNFKSLHNIEIEGSLTELTDRATITIPRNWEFRDRLITDYIKEGQAVEIKLGYNGENETEFTGYVSRIKPGIPLVIECEDEMFKLKQAVANKSWRKATLAELVAHVAPDHTSELIDPQMQLGKFEVVNSTGTQVLEGLKKFGLYSYFSGKILKIGFLSGLTGNHARHSYDKWSIKDGSGLSYLTAEDQRYKVKAISNNPDGKKLTAEHGDTDGDLRTFNYIGKTKTELETLAKAEHAALKKARCKGELVGFGVPRTRPGDIAEIDNPSNPDTDGTFLIERTVLSFGDNGFERRNRLGVQLS